MADAAGQSDDISYHQYTRHLTGTLTPERLDFYHDHPDDASIRFPYLDPKWFVSVSLGFCRGINILWWVEDRIRAGIIESHKDFEVIWSRLRSVIGESVSVQIDHLTHQLSNRLDTFCMESYFNVMSSANLKRVGKEKIAMIVLHNEMARKAEAGEESFRLHNYPDIQYDPEKKKFLI